MKKILELVTGLFVFSAVNVFAVSISDLTVTGATNASGAVTISATIGGATAAMVTYQITSTNGLNRRYFPPSNVSGTSWSDSSWEPYFTGAFVIEVNAWDDAAHAPPVTAFVTVTVSRAISGTINSIKWSTAPYSSDAGWSDVDTRRVNLHDIGLRQEPGGAASIGCNLLNVTNLMERVSDEQRDMAYDDTSPYKPAGTPYRFDINLHARPFTFMGMGEIKRWVWHPTDTNVPGGPGRLELDITSCSPWRSSYSNALQSHVGFAPIFFTSGAGASVGASMPTGMIMCTSAHYMDVGPTNTGTAEGSMRCGLRVDGHTGTNSYVKMFLSDTFLQQQFGLTNVYEATNLMAGFVQHLNTNGVPVDNVTQVTVSFTRIEGGSNLVYDYNSDGQGDSGYEARLDFEFHSRVAAQMGMASTNVTTTTYNLAGDIDGDRLADLMTVVSNSWYVWFSSAQYLMRGGPFAFSVSGTPVTGDVDGDRLADIIVVSGTSWYVWLSSSLYATHTNYTLNVSGTPVTGDIDGDGKAELISVSGTSWYVWFSSAQYLVRGGPYAFNVSGTPVTGDIDGDGLADIIVVSGTSWYVWFSSAQYLVRGGPYAFNVSGLPAEAALQALQAGTPVTGDVDGDRLADIMSVLNGTNWYAWFSSAQYLVRGGPYVLSSP